MKAQATSCAVVFALVLAGCADQRINASQESLGKNISYSQNGQINEQLSRSIDDPYSVPSFSFVSAAQLNATDTLSATGQYTSAMAGLTRQATATMGPVNNQFQYTSSPIGDPDALRMARDIYAYTVGETPWNEEFATLTMKPPRNHWLVYSNDMSSGSHAGLYLIGRYGNHVLWTKSRRDYSDFVLSVLGAVSKPVVASETGAAAGKGKAKAGKAKAPPTRSFNSLNVPLFMQLGPPAQ
ncbi:MAG: hypothetical protein EOR72_20345 [Mesorhizobium sp.]|uniref:hypothetical protein n=1 Tax=Mesorhizobium sp. TaxID=1871066 RepID=UPI000FE48CE6|nr:hypothetical protein [Mesorhizobium sp.]RWM12873.1 MAG: hypothetical protein EOR72_20345 [Mesorhizobium sp.]